VGKDMALILSASLLQLFPYLDENMSVDYLSPTFSRRLHAFFYFGLCVAERNSIRQSRRWGGDIMDLAKGFEDDHPSPTSLSLRLALPCEQP